MTELYGPRQPLVEVASVARGEGDPEPWQLGWKVQECCAAVQWKKTGRRNNRLWREVARQPAG